MGRKEERERRPAGPPAYETARKSTPGQARKAKAPKSDVKKAVRSTGKSRARIEERTPEQQIEERPGVEVLAHSDTNVGESQVTAKLDLQEMAEVTSGAEDEALQADTQAELESMAGPVSEPAASKPELELRAAEAVGFMEVDRWDSTAGETDLDVELGAVELELRLSDPEAGLIARAEEKEETSLQFGAKVPRHAELENSWRRERRLERESQREASAAEEEATRAGLTAQRAVEQASDSLDDEAGWDAHRECRERSVEAVPEAEWE